MSFELAPDETPGTEPMEAVKVEAVTGGLITYEDGLTATVLTPADAPADNIIAVPAPYVIPIETKTEVITELSVYERIRRFSKWWVAFTGAVATASATIGTALAEHDTLTLSDGINTGIAVLTALGVLTVRNGKKK